MRRICLFLLLVSVCAFWGQETVFCKTDDSRLCYTNFSKKELLNDLAFAENQVFKKVFSNKSMTERLENLEINILGAIQDGEEDFRIKKIRNAVTNVASGGKGLQYTMKALNLGANALSSNNWSVGNMHNYYPRSYNRNGYGQRYYNGYSNMLPPRPCHSHRLPPPPPPQNYNYSPYTNGDFAKNYSIGTSIKILDD